MPFVVPVVPEPPPPPEPPSEGDAVVFEFAFAATGGEAITGTFRAVPIGDPADGTQVYEVREWLTFSVGSTDIENIAEFPYPPAADADRFTWHIANEMVVATEDSEGFISFEDEDDFLNLRILAGSSAGRSSFFGLLGSTSTLYDSVSTQAATTVLVLQEEEMPEMPDPVGDPRSYTWTVAGSSGTARAAFASVINGIFEQEYEGTDSNEGSWIHRDSNRVSSGTSNPIGPAFDNATFPFVHTETTSTEATEAAMDAAEIRGILFLKGDGSVTDSGGNDIIEAFKSEGRNRMLTIRHCIQGQFGTDTGGLEGLYIAGSEMTGDPEDIAEDDWTTIGWLPGWPHPRLDSGGEQTSPRPAGQSVTDFTGTAFTVAANGGWRDTVISIPNNYRQIRLKPRYTLGPAGTTPQNQPFLHDICLWRIIFDWNDPPGNGDSGNGADQLLWGSDQPLWGTDMLEWGAAS